MRASTFNGCPPLDVLRVPGGAFGQVEMMQDAEMMVKFHVHNILSKLAVDDHTQAIIVALKRGMITL